MYISHYNNKTQSYIASALNLSNNGKKKKHIVIQILMLWDHPCSRRHAIPLVAPNISENENDLCPCSSFYQWVGPELPTRREIINNCTSLPKRRRPEAPLGRPTGGARRRFPPRHLSRVWQPNPANGRDEGHHLGPPRHGKKSRLRIQKSSIIRVFFLVIIIRILEKERPRGGSNLDAPLARPRVL